MSSAVLTFLLSGDALATAAVLVVACSCLPDLGILANSAHLLRRPASSTGLSDHDRRTANK